MRKLELADLATLAGGQLRLPDGVPSTPVGPDVVVDARRATPGSVFVAIPGERVDGHDFTAQAAGNGAGAVLATRMTPAPLPHVLVDEPVQALSRLARGVVATERERGLVTLAVTGSSGKTSTKDLLAQVLEAAGPTVSPVGSFNNEIGVPLTACGVDAGTRFLVSELGARGQGHIAWLCSITAPSISLVLNVGTAHLGEFGSREGIARAKGEIVEALDPQGWAVLNADDDLVAPMAGRTTARLAWWTRTGWQLQHGTRPEGELHVSATDIAANALEQYHFTLVAERDGHREQAPVQLRLLGSHQVSNALAAATAALAAGLDLATVARALDAATTRSPWRMQMDVRPDGAAVLNDAYNANPSSMGEAIRTVGRIGEARRREDPGARTWAVLGDMLELGDEGDRLHREVGELAVRCGIDEVVAVGEHAEQIVAGALAAGGRARASRRDEVAGSIVLGPTDVVLVKASRGLALETVAEGLLGESGAGGAVVGEASVSGVEQ